MRLSLQSRIGFAALLLPAASLLAQSQPPASPPAARPPAPSYVRGGLDQRSLIGAYDQLTADQQVLCDAVTKWLMEADEIQADRLVKDFLASHPTDAKVSLLRATMVRGRFEIAAATPLFQTVVDSFPGTPEAAAATAMLHIDAGDRTASAFAPLYALGRSDINDRCTLWLCMLAAQAAGHYQLGFEFGRTATYAGQVPLRVWCLSSDFGARSQTDPTSLESDHGQLGNYYDLRRIRPAWAGESFALSLTALKVLDDAQDTIDQVLALNPKNPAALKIASEIAFRAGQYDQAIAQAGKALELDPQLFRAHVWEALALEKLGRTTEAQAAYRAAAMWTPTRPAHVVAPPLLAQADIPRLPPDKAAAEILQYIAAGKEKDIRPVLQQVVEKYPNDQLLLFLKFTSDYHDFSVPTRPTALIPQIIAVDPTSVLGKFASHILNAQASSPARDDLDALIKITREHPDDMLLNWAAGGVVSFADQMHAGARTYLETIEFYEKAQRTMVAAPEGMHFLFANALDDVGDHERALAQRKISTPISRDGGWNYNGLGRTLGDMRFYADADAAFAISLKNIDFLPERWDFWACMLCNWGHYDDALDKHQHAVELGHQYQYIFDGVYRTLQFVAKTSHGPAQIERFAHLYETLGSDNDKFYAGAIRKLIPETRPPANP